MHSKVHLELYIYVYIMGVGSEAETVKTMHPRYLVNVLMCRKVLAD